MPTPEQAHEFLWRKGNLAFKLQPQQVPIYESVRALPDGIDEAVLLCSRQFGKSYLGVILAIEDCIRHPGKCVLIVGPTLKQTREIVTPRLRELAQDSPEGLIRPLKSESKWIIGESELVIGGFDVNSTSQRGKTVQTIYVEEIVDSHPDNYIEAMRSDLGPALTRSKGGRMIFLTTLPKFPDHPFVVETMTKAEYNNALYVYTIDDNKELTQAQYDACVRRAGGKDSIDFRREYMCELVRDPTILVVPDFEESRHVKDFEYMDHCHMHIGGDWGGVRDMTALLLMSHDFANDRILVFDERIFPPNTSTNAIIAEARKMEGGRICSRSIDMPGQLQVDLTAYGFEAQMPPKDDWRAAINSMAVKFSLNKIWVHKRCRFLIQSLRSGTFNKNKTDFERTSILGHCDALAALMYGIRTQPTHSPYAIEQKMEGYSFTSFRRPAQDDSLSGLSGKQFGGYKRFGK